MSEKKRHLWLLVVYVTLIGAMNSLVLSYFPLYFQWKGLSLTQIGSLLALGTFFGLLGQPFWGFLSDTFKTVKKILLVILIGSLVGVMLIAPTTHIFWLFCAAAFFYFFYNTFFPLSENLTKRYADQVGANFGVIRSFPAFGFAIVTLISGFIFKQLGISYLSLLLLILGGITLLFGFLIEDVQSGTKKIDFKQVGQFLKNPTLILFFFVVSFISIPHRINDAFISLHLQDIGGDEVLVGWLWFMAVLSEAFTFLTSKYWFQSTRQPIIYVIIAGALYLVRWLLIGWVTNPYVLIFIQLFHGVCYGVFFMGCIEYLFRLLLKELQATGHMVFVLVVFGLTGILGQMVGGYLFDELGGSTLYQLMAGWTVLGLIGVGLFHMQGKAKEKEASTWKNDISG